MSREGISLRFSKVMFMGLQSESCTRQRTAQGIGPLASPTGGPLRDRPAIPASYVAARPAVRTSAPHYGGAASSPRS